MGPRGASAHTCPRRWCRSSWAWRSFDRAPSTGATRRSVYVVALALQVGTNYANDYSDGIRGTDEVRVGPFRLTASKLVAAKHGSQRRLRRVLPRRCWRDCCSPRARRGGWSRSARRRSPPAGSTPVDRDPTATTASVSSSCSSTSASWRPSAPRTCSTSRFRVVRGGSASRRASWLVRCSKRTTCATSTGDRSVGQEDAGRATRIARAHRGSSRSAWLGVLVGIAGVGHTSSLASSRSSLYVPAIRLAFSTKNGRELLPMLKYSARAQLQLGALLALVLILRIGDMKSAHRAAALVAGCSRWAA